MTDRELLELAAKAAGIKIHEQDSEPPEAYAVPLHELLAGVPKTERLVIDAPDGMGTQFIPVGRYCHEAAAELRRQHGEIEAMRNERFANEKKLRRLHEVNAELVEALEKLAKLGNGDRYGNSIGNEIAQEALRKAREDNNA